MSIDPQTVTTFIVGDGEETGIPKDGELSSPNKSPTVQRTKDPSEAKQEEWIAGLVPLSNPTTKWSKYTRTSYRVYILKKYHLTEYELSTLRYQEVPNPYNRRQKARLYSNAQVQALVRKKAKALGINTWALERHDSNWHKPNGPCHCWRCEFSTLCYLSDAEGY